MGKSSKTKVGSHYRLALHFGLVGKMIDVLLEFRAADKTAWQGALTASGRIQVDAPNLFGGEKDQGGLTGPLDVMFGDADQVPNPYLVSVFGNQTAAWRGFTTAAWAGGRWGAMSPFAQKPAWKLRKIVAGWDEPGCWYPEKAEIWMLPEVTFIDDLAFPATSAAVGPYAGITIDSGFTAADVLIVSKPPGLTYQAWSRWSSDSSPLTEGYPWANDFWVTDDKGDTVQYFRSNTHPNPDIDDFETAAGADAAFRNRYVALSGSSSYTFWLFDEPVTDNRGGLSLRVWKGGMIAMNPAHTLYYSRTDSEKGREARANINDASLRAAADRLHEEGFGLCWEYDPARDTPDAFEQRICRIIGGSFERSLTDGQWYLDLARGDYDIESLPIIGDDDILDFKELPTTLDRAVNSVAVRYFDVERKESVITPAVRALGLIRRFGEIHEILDFPEIPTGSLAIRVAERELRAYVTPKRTFEITTNPRAKALRRNQNFRLQVNKRRIADMVCIVGSKEAGTLPSGAMRWKVSQDVYSLPDTSYVEIEEGVDTRPPQTPVPIEHARAFEAPYIDVCANLPRSELAVLPDDVGYLLGVAAWPGVGIDYAMCVRPDGGDYALAANGDWNPSATADGAVPAEIGPTVVQLIEGASVAVLDSVPLGTAVMWDDEWCRLDDLDIDLMTATLGRGCADTVPQLHADGSRLWFLDAGVAADRSEYTDGEAVNVKFLPATGSQQLPIDSATAIPLEFGGRQARPYPPAGLTVNTEAYPDYLYGPLVLDWAHRDRVLQADQLIDQATTSVGPEPGTTYTVRAYVNDVLDSTQTGITGATANVDPSGEGFVRIEVESELDGLLSWQMQVREFDYTSSPADPWELQGSGVLQTQFGNAIHLMTE